MAEIITLTAPGQAMVLPELNVQNGVRAVVYGILFGVGLFAVSKIITPNIHLNPRCPSRMGKKMCKRCPGGG